MHGGAGGDGCVWFMNHSKPQSSQPVNPLLATTWEGPRSGGADRPTPAGDRQLPRPSTRHNSPSYDEPTTDRVRELEQLPRGDSLTRTAAVRCRECGSCPRGRDLMNCYICMTCAHVRKDAHNSHTPCTPARGPQHHRRPHADEMAAINTSQPHRTTAPATNSTERSSIGGRRTLTITDRGVSRHSLKASSL